MKQIKKEIEEEMSNVVEKCKNKLFTEGLTTSELRDIAVTLAILYDKQNNLDK